MSKQPTLEELRQRTPQEWEEHQLLLAGEDNDDFDILDLNEEEYVQNENEDDDFQMESDEEERDQQAGASSTNHQSDECIESTSTGNTITQMQIDSSDDDVEEEDEEDEDEEDDEEDDDSNFTGSRSSFVRRSTRRVVEKKSNDNQRQYISPPDQVLIATFYELHNGKWSDIKNDKDAKTLLDRYGIVRIQNFIANQRRSLTAARASQTNNNHRVRTTRAASNNNRSSTNNVRGTGSHNAVRARDPARPLNTGTLMR